MAKNMKNKVLDVNDLHVSFDTYAGEVQAVRGVTFQLHEGEVLAIVGESGCGKSVTAQTIMKLNPCLLYTSAGDALLCGPQLCHPVR